ncbi:MAG: PEP-CTERM sorting domain-containing protein [Phycisphaerae bacterium]|nr:PEP-CTERM sorting domain-containing protein [Phycisphaerales bacterium]
MMNRNFNFAIAAGAVMLSAGAAFADQFQLVTGVGAGTSPGAARTVTTTSGGSSNFFTDGQRLGGTPSASPIGIAPGSTFLQTPNQYGSLSFMFRRGSINFGGPATPFLSVDYLGGPLLDLDGDLGNGSRSLVPVSGQSAVEIPGTTSHMDLTFGAGSVSLNSFDVNGNNAGLGPAAPEQLVTVNTLAGTSTTGTPGSAINPSIDDRSGTATSFLGLSGTLGGVTRVEGLGYEFWQDTLSATSSSADELGTAQFMGEMRGWKIERDINGNFPTLAGEGLGSTIWSAVDTSQVGNSFNNAIGAGTSTIVNGNPNDDFSAPGNGGLDLTDFGGDLGAYLDHIAATAIDPNSQSFVYFEGAGFGINNPEDPVFYDSSGWDVVLIAQSAPVPEPTSLVLILAGCAGILGYRKNRN